MSNIEDLNKKFNDLVNRIPFWKIYLVSVPIMTIFIFIMFAVFFPLILTSGDLSKVNFLIELKISFSLSLIMSLMSTLMINMSKQSDKFWKSSEELSKMIDDANTKDELREIYSTKYMEVNKLASGSPHYSEMKRLYSIIETKFKYVN
jgi:hypothetical protein